MRHLIKWKASKANMRRTEDEGISAQVEQHPPLATWGITKYAWRQNRLLLEVQQDSCATVHLLYALYDDA